MAPRARQAKSKARINAYEQMAAEQGREQDQELEIQIPPGQPSWGPGHRSGRTCNKAFDDKVLMENVNFRLPPGGIVGIIGPNGAGKTTLFRMITGDESVDSGQLRIGETVELGTSTSRGINCRRTTRYSRKSRVGTKPLELGKRKVERAGLRFPFQFPRSGPAEKSRRSVRW